MTRGRISMICKDYAIVKNKFFKSSKANKPTSSFIYTDANNLYGHFMMQHLPTDVLDQVNPRDFNLDIYSKDGSIGCFVEDDLDCFDELHDRHNEGEKVKVTEEMLSEYKLFCL